MDGIQIYTAVLMGILVIASILDNDMRSFILSVMFSIPWVGRIYGWW